MAFDAGMLACVLGEIQTQLIGGKIEKIYMPQRDMVILVLKNGRDAFRLLINAGSSSPRLCITDEKAENPATPPMFCMMLRKHLGGAKLTGVDQLGFERVARFTFETYDELGFKTSKYIIAEIMGKYSNLILSDNDDKMIGILKPVDFTTSQKRQLLPGMRYEVPPPQAKDDPLSASVDSFNRVMGALDPDSSAEKALLHSYLGMSSLTAREIVYRSAGRTDATLRECSGTLWREFSEYAKSIRNHTAVPYLIVSPEGAPEEYSYMEILQYGNSKKSIRKDTFSELIDSYFEDRSRIDSLRQRGADLIHLLSTALTRIEKKLAVQMKELSECDAGETYRLYGDLLTSNICRLKKGAGSVVLDNYYEPGTTVEIPLNALYTPAQNAQMYYKKYNKTKSAKKHLTEQIEKSNSELVYIQSVQESLARAENEKDLIDIRQELYMSGYASRMRNFTVRKQTTPAVMQFRTSDGRRVYCGKNNTANDYLTTKLADRSDWWFHVKNQPGSHVVLTCDGESDEPTDRDFTSAAEIAAYYSSARDGVMVPVDYTRVRYVKKPAGAKPGFVIYTTNWTAYVTPQKEKVEAMREK